MSTSSGNRWWVFVNKSTGAAVISNRPGVTPPIVKAVGAKTRLQVESHSFPGSFSDAVDQAFGTLGLSGNQLPTSYQPTSGANFMPLAGNINTAPFNTGGPVTPGVTHPQAQAASQTVQTLTGAIGGINGFLQFIGWLFHPLNWLRAVEFLAGFILMILGLRSSSRAFRGAVASPTPPVSRAIRRTVRAVAR